MKIRYERNDDVLMVELAPEARIDHAEQSGSFILHLDRQDRPVLLEILQASDFIANSVRASMRAELLAA